MEHLGRHLMDHRDVTNAHPAKHEESNGNNETERFIIKMQASENFESSQLQSDIPGMLKRGFHIHASLRNVFLDFTLDERRIIRFIIEKEKKIPRTKTKSKDKERAGRGVKGRQLESKISRNKGCKVIKISKEGNGHV